MPVLLFWMSDGNVAALGIAWCTIGSSHSGFPEDDFSVTALPFAANII